MKKLYLFIFLLSSFVSLNAQMPCRFTWQAVRLPSGAIADYTSPQVETQPYQGPCMAFALVAALEAQYEIDHNSPNRNLDLSEAFVDYKIDNWNNANLIGAFNSGFAIPEEAAGNFSQRCQNEFDCDLRGDAFDCINLGQCFEVIDEWIEPGNYWEQRVECKTCPSGIKRARGNTVEKINSGISSIDNFKAKLIFEGPMIVKLNGSSNTNALYQYGAGTDLAFHAVTIIGWKEVNGGIRLHFKDSWPGSGNFKYSRIFTHNQLLARINQGNSPGSGFELFQVRNAQVVGERTRGINFSYFSPGAQCTPIPAPTPSLMLLNEPVIKRNQPMTLYSAINCSGEPAIDWQWVIPSSSVHTPVKNNCNSTVVFTTNTSNSHLQIKVRAKSSSGGWSNWHIKTFIVDNNLN